MKTRYWKIIVLAGAAMILAVALPVNARDRGGGRGGWVEGERDWPRRVERMERMMDQLRETDPNKAAELEKLRETDPNAFRAAIRETMRARLKEEMQRDDVGRPGPKGEMMRGRLRERGEEYLEWLKANYPEEAERLAELQKNKPELYRRQLWLGARKYGRIAEAAQENPELAKILKEDMELRNKSFEILRKIKAATDDTERQKLTAELEQAVNARFDVILQRKQMEYERLRQEIERLQEQVRQNEVQLEKWKTNKAERVKERVKELLSRTEKFEWD